MRSLKTFIMAGIVMGLFALSYTQRYTFVNFEKDEVLYVQAEIKGEVASPGIYTLSLGSSMADLIEKAGGLSDEADTSAISLQREVADDDIVIIPKQDASISLVSINTASIEQLQTLPGIGPAMAARIVEYRQQTPFYTLEDLMEVKGIGEKMFEKLKDLICL